MQITGLQLDLLTAIRRLEQLQDLADRGQAGSLGVEILWDRVITCDVPRLRTHLSAEARAFESWSDHVDADQSVGQLLHAEERQRHESLILGRVLDGLRRL